MAQEEIDRQVKLLNDFITEDVQRIKSLQCRIGQYQCNIIELQKPKYTAKDFPCLYYGNDGIQYTDDSWIYEIDETTRRCIKTAISFGKSGNYIDSHIDITECKLSNIKPGDYFACIDYKNDIGKYRYCTLVTEIIIRYDYGENGYIKNHYIDNDPMTSNSYVKFILKDK